MDVLNTLNTKLIYGALLIGGITIHIHGLPELIMFGENVCGPRTEYYNASRTVKDNGLCPSGPCEIYRIEFYTKTDDNVYYCCDGFSQTNDTGASCSKACEQGRYGENCTETCDCPALCHAKTGNCLCDPGEWKYPDCAECPDGTYGINCAGDCDCQNGATCDKGNGTCYDVTTIGITTEVVLPEKRDGGRETDREWMIGQNRTEQLLIFTCIALGIIVVIYTVVLCVVLLKKKFPRIPRDYDTTKNDTEHAEVDNGPIYIDVLESDQPQSAQNPPENIQHTYMDANMNKPSAPLEGPIVNTGSDRIYMDANVDMFSPSSEGPIVTTGSDPVAYAESTDQQKTAQIDILHTYMEADKNTAPVKRPIVNTSSDPVAYAESGVMLTGERHNKPTLEYAYAYDHCE